MGDKKAAYHGARCCEAAMDPDTATFKVKYTGVHPPASRTCSCKRAARRARHNRASAAPRSMHTLPTARCCIRSSNAVRHS